MFVLLFDISSFFSAKPVLTEPPAVQPTPSYNHPEPWMPAGFTVFKALLSARLCAAIWSNISDCDETYNYWEPVSEIYIE